MTTVLKITVSIDLPDNQPAPKIEVATEPPLATATSSVPDLDPAVTDQVTTNASKAQAPALLDYLRRCVIELGARPEVPTSGNRPGINLNPPVGVRGARLASIYVPSGRVAFREIAPSEVGDFEGAEIVENNRVPDHVKIYLNTEQDVDRAMVLTKAVLDRR